MRKADGALWEETLHSNVHHDRTTQVDPATAYRSPRELCEDRTLSQSRKIALLRQWEYDLRSIEVAKEENMTSTGSATPGANAEVLREVRRALYALGDSATDQAQPTKQGGFAGES